MSGSSRPLPGDPLARLLESDLQSSDALAFEDALSRVLRRHPEVRGAAVYAMARGEAMIRIVTPHGWLPVLVRASERSDAPAIERRLESAFEP